MEVGREMAPTGACTAVCGILLQHQRSGFAEKVRFAFLVILFLAAHSCGAGCVSYCMISDELCVPGLSQNALGLLGPRRERTHHVPDTGASTAAYSIKTNAVATVTCDE